MPIIRWHQNIIIHAIATWLTWHPFPSLSFPGPICRHACLHHAYAITLHVHWQSVSMHLDRSTGWRKSSSAVRLIGNLLSINFKNLAYGCVSWQWHFCSYGNLRTYVEPQYVLCSFTLLNFWGWGHIPLNFGMTIHSRLETDFYYIISMKSQVKFLQNTSPTLNDLEEQKENIITAWHATAKI